MVQESIRGNREIESSVAFQHSFVFLERTGVEHDLAYRGLALRFQIANHQMAYRELPYA